MRIRKFGFIFHTFAFWVLFVAETAHFPGQSCSPLPTLVVAFMHITCPSWIHFSCFVNPWNFSLSKFIQYHPLQNRNVKRASKNLPTSAKLAKVNPFTIVFYLAIFITCSSSSFYVPPLHGPKAQPDTTRKEELWWIFPPRIVSVSLSLCTYKKGSDQVTSYKAGFLTSALLSLQNPTSYSHDDYKNSFLDSLVVKTCPCGDPNPKSNT